VTEEQALRVRDAMIAEPRALPASATAQEAGEVLTPAEVRAVYIVGDDEGFRFIEEEDAERVPVVDGGRLVGVVSRAVLQRRLAEDEEPAAEDP
jgi:CBS domain-containing protein